MTFVIRSLLLSRRMIQGWHNDDYLILFEEHEVILMMERYDAATFLPGYTICGLKGWDDFIVRDSARQLWTAPTVPLAAKHLSQFTFHIGLSALRPDGRLTDRIRLF